MKNKIVTYISIILNVVLIVLFANDMSYSWFKGVVEGTGNDMVVSAGKIELTYVDGSAFTLSDASPGDYQTKTMYITNTGTFDTAYKLKWSPLLNTFTNNEIVVTYNCTSYINYGEASQAESGSCTDFTRSVPTRTSSSSGIIKGSISIPVGVTHEYTVTVTFIETGSAQNYNQGKSFSGKITIEESGNNYTCATNTFTNGTLKYHMLNSDCAYPDNVETDYVTSTTGISFNAISSETNGQGLYYTEDTDETDENNDGTGSRIYYYRGEIDNNYVIFAGYCWRIVRTSENGSIKLRYGGTPTSGVCLQTGTSVSIGSSVFNSSSSYNAYVGYMYGTPNSATYALEHANTNNSTIKTTIDSWYNTNIASQGTTVTSKISDSIYCNDRSITDTTYNLGYGANRTYYAAYSRLTTNKTPTNKCTLANDRFTVSSSNGNGALTYPVGLLTADEMAYAGAKAGTNNTTFYLYTSAYYWTMSPYYFSSGYSRGCSLYPSGGLSNSDVGLASGALPAVFLNAETTVSSGVGTYNSPYVIN